MIPEFKKHIIFDSLTKISLLENNFFKLGCTYNLMNCIILFVIKKELNKFHLILKANLISSIFLELD